jgi:hypothetical protein
MYATYHHRNANTWNTQCCTYQTTPLLVSWQIWSVREGIPPLYWNLKPPVTVCRKHNAGPEFDTFNPDHIYPQIHFSIIPPFTTRFQNFNFALIFFLPLCVLRVPTPTLPWRNRHNTSFKPRSLNKMLQVPSAAVCMLLAIFPFRVSGTSTMTTGTTPSHRVLTSYRQLFHKPLHFMSLNTIHSTLFRLVAMFWPPQSTLIRGGLASL